MKKIAADRNYRLMKVASPANPKATIFASMTPDQQELCRSLYHDGQNLGRREAIDEVLSLLDSWYETYDGSAIAPQSLRDVIRPLGDSRVDPYGKGN